MMFIEKFNKRYEQRLGNDSIYGNGSDGDFVITNTGVPTVLTRDMYYDTLEIDANCTLITNGFRIFVKTNLINNGVIGADLTYTTAITDGTVAGQSTSEIIEYTVSQESSNPLPLSLFNDIEKAISGYFIDISEEPRILRGGQRGASGSNGSGHTLGTDGADGTDGVGGTGATSGTANNGTAGNAGGGLPGHYHYAHGGSGVFYNFHSHGTAGGNPGNPGHANSGINGVKGTKGLKGNPGNPGSSGTGGAGGVGGPIVVIAAKSITGTGVVVSYGQSGTAGTSGSDGQDGSGASSGNAGNAGAAGNATNGNAGNDGHGATGWVHAHDSGFHNPGHAFGATANHGFRVNSHTHMRTYGGTPGRPSNESNGAHFPQHAHRNPGHAFHWTGPTSFRTWPRGSNPANVGHFTVGRGHHFVSGHNPNTAHYQNSNAHHTAHYFHVPGGTRGNAGNAAAGVAGNPGNPGNPGSNGLKGLAGSPGGNGLQGAEGVIVVITDNWGLNQTLSSSTKIIINV
jgi:hypothetical protein